MDSEKMKKEEKVLITLRAYIGKWVTAADLCCAMHREFGMRAEVKSPRAMAQLIRKFGFEWKKPSRCSRKYLITEV